MVKYVKTEQGYVDASIFAPAQFKPEGKSYLTFSSPNNFTLEVNNRTKNWDGILEYFAYDKTWTVWDGTTILSAYNNGGEYVLYLRGTGNTKITGNGINKEWIITGTDVKCIGNIENLLDYITVEAGNHPTMTTSCYSYMFKNCTSITQAPALPATTLADYCYQLMFYGCTALTQAPALPATTLANSCYQLMFEGCTALTQAPDLPATTLVHWCYRNMFYGCTALTQAPALPATTLANSCYQLMFEGCTALTQAPALPATTLADYCYSSMFSGCSSLTQAPELPATSLANSCYESMFSGCTALKLSSTKTVEYAQEYRIPTTGTGTTATNALTNMFVSTGGTFTGTPAINTTYYLSTDNMIVRDTEVATLNGYVGSMIDNSVSNPLNITGATVGQIAKITAVDESGKPTEWEAVDMPGGGGVQPDWNQNDSTQPDYVKNRPFYTGNPVETVLVEESTVSFAEAGGGMYQGELSSTFSPTIGETYKVSWDGTVYECVCVSKKGSGIIGNASFVNAGSDSGEPFCMIVPGSGEPGSGKIIIGSTDTSASHTVSISATVVPVVKIDAKYLPNTVATKSEVEVAQNTADEGQSTANEALYTANNAQTTANNAQTTANNAKTTANNAKSEALDLAARMFGHTSVVDNAFYRDKTLSITSLPACIESIGANAFSGCTNLALTSLPSGITSIGNGAFFGCTKLALTSLPSGLTSIGFQVFQGCTKLALTSLPSGLTSIDSHAFDGCIKLALTSLPSGLTSIGSNAFSGCFNLALTSLPSGLTSIRDYAFFQCTKLALTSLPSGLTSIGANAFSGCIKLALTSLPSGITSIRASAFQGCTGLTSITFTGKPTTIISSAFAGCTNLTTINVPWAEGEVANAPWGATNATINYNYTEV